MEKLLLLARQWIVEFEQSLAQMEVTEQAIAQAEIISKQLQQPDLFARYQGNISRELYKAIDGLEAISSNEIKRVLWVRLVKPSANNDDLDWN